MPSMFAVRLRWVIITPLGSPVVPDVNMISARSLLSMGMGSGSGRPDMAASSSSKVISGTRRSTSPLGVRREVKAMLGVGARYDPGDVVGRAAKVQGARERRQPSGSRRRPGPSGASWGPRGWPGLPCRDLGVGGGWPPGPESSQRRLYVQRRYRKAGLMRRASRGPYRTTASCRKSTMVPGTGATGIAMASEALRERNVRFGLRAAQRGVGGTPRRSFARVGSG